MLAHDSLAPNSDASRAARRTISYMGALWRGRAFVFGVVYLYLKCDKRAHCGMDAGAATRITTCVLSAFQAERGIGSQ